MNQLSHCLDHGPISAREKLIRFELVRAYSVCCDRHCGSQPVQSPPSPIRDHAILSLHRGCSGVVGSIHKYTNHSGPKCILKAARRRRPFSISLINQVSYTHKVLREDKVVALNGRKRVVLDEPSWRSIIAQGWPLDYSRRRFRSLSNWSTVWQPRTIIPICRPANFSPFWPSTGLWPGLAKGGLVVGGVVSQSSPDTVQLFPPLPTSHAY